jgi:[protein-PII] uridylyltransferase
MSTTVPVDAAEPLLEQCSPGLVPELRSYLSRHRLEVESMVRTAGREAGVPASRRYAKVFDGLLGSLFHATAATMSKRGNWRPVSLAAIGSFGRGALALHSDLDVRLLCKDMDGSRAVAESLLYPLWDAGLSIGHQVVTTSELIELARGDLPTATGLLDWRLIAGDPTSSQELLSRAFEGLFGTGNIRQFLERLESRAVERSGRYGGSVFLLEPDVKHGLGGLRDLDVAHWAARARWRVNDLSELVRIGVLVSREWQQIEAANHMFFRVRNLLHVYAGRRSDRLSFDRQEALAQDLGYGGGGPAVERFMSEYYRHARTISQARDMIMARAAPPSKRRPTERLIGRGLKLTNECVSLEDPGALETDPSLALRLYDEAVRRDLPVYSFARDAVARAVSSLGFCEKLRGSQEAAKLFVKLCQVAQRTRTKSGSVVQELHDVGLLVAMVPEFSPVVGRVHHDLYHVYTVDAHSVAAVDRLCQLCRGELAAEFGIASRLAAEIARPQVLFFATLLHDVGKDIGGKNHSERGHEMARSILERLGVLEPDIREVQHLILKHLRMYHVATRRDIDDPKTVEEFSKEVHGAEGLRELYLLTVADVSTTSPTAMTSWKARMLDELYVAANRCLSEGPLASASAERLEEVRQSVRAMCPERGEREFLDHFLAAMPERYLYANEEGEILRHSRFARQAQEKQLSVTVMTDDDPYVELGFIADDRPGLLAMITATLAAARLKVVGAQIYSWKDNYGRTRVLDLFWVRGGTSAENVHKLVPRLERDFGKLLGEQLAPRDLVMGKKAPSSWSERPAPKVATEVGVDNRGASQHTLIEVTTRDRLGLLFCIANTLQEAGLTIALAKINTEGNRVADVFYVSDVSGEKLLDPERIETLKKNIVTAIEQLEIEGFT